MDFGIIEALYYGNISPNLHTKPKDEALEQVFVTFDEAEDYLTEHLAGEEKKALLRLLNAHSEMIGTLSFQNFQNGYRVGTLLMLDTMAGMDNVLEED